MTPPAWLARVSLRVLAVLLLGLEPIGLAFWLSSLLPRLLDRGPAAWILVALRLAATALGIAAGLQLWHERPGATRLARGALLAAALTAGLTASTRWLPTSRPPGLVWPLTVAITAYYLSWLAWVWWIELAGRGGSGGRRDSNGP